MKITKQSKQKFFQNQKAFSVFYSFIYKYVASDVIHFRKGRWMKSLLNALSRSRCLPITACYLIQLDFVFHHDMLMLDIYRCCIIFDTLCRHLTKDSPGKLGGICGLSLCASACVLGVRVRFVRATGLEKQDRDAGGKSYIVLIKL